MAAELEKLAKELTEQGHSVGAQLVKDSSKSWLKAGLIPKKLENNVLSREELPQTVELNLDEEWQRQSARFVELGYHTELKIKDGEYLDSLPRFGTQPEEYKGRFDLPLIVETRIPWPKQAELAGIGVSDYLRARIDQTSPWQGNNQETPDAAYSGWFNNWNQRFTRRIPPFDARKKLAADEVGAGPLEGITLQVVHPELTKDGKYFDLIGYQVGSGLVPSLSYWDDRPRLGAHWGDDAHGDFRPLVRGSKVVTG